MGAIGNTNSLILNALPEERNMATHIYIYIYIYIYIIRGCSDLHVVGPIYQGRCQDWSEGEDSQKVQNVSVVASGISKFHVILIVRAGRGPGNQPPPPLDTPLAYCKLGSSYTSQNPQSQPTKSNASLLQHDVFRPDGKAVR